MVRTLRFQSWRTGRESLLFQCNCCSFLVICAVYQWLRILHLARKLVSVEFAALGLAFPTFNLGFYHVLAFSLLGTFVLLRLYLKVLLLILLLFLRACSHDGVRFDFFNVLEFGRRVPSYWKRKAVFSTSTMGKSTRFDADGRKIEDRQMPLVPKKLKR